MIPVWPGYQKRMRLKMEKLERETHASIDYWIDAFRKYDLEQLTHKPSENQWSLGQVGIHLWMSAKGFFFKNAELCLGCDGTQEGSKTLSGHVVFTLGMMPPVKYEMPRQVAVQPRQPESKEQLIAKMEEVKGMVSHYLGFVPNSDPDMKIKHPFLGWLNTAEWVQLCNIHFRHHMRQKKRIEAHFGWK